MRKLALATVVAALAAALALSHRAFVAYGRSDAAGKRNAEFESRCARPPAR